MYVVNKHLKSPNLSPWGHSNSSVVHRRDQRNTKKDCFLKLIAIRGQNVPIFKKKGPFRIQLWDV